MNFGALDWVIVVVYLFMTFGLGVLAIRYVHGLADFLVVARELRVYLGVATLCATEIGLVTLMYFGQESYERGFSALVVGIIVCLAYFVVGQTGFLIARLRRLRIMTVPEFYGIRYSSGVRVLGAVILTVGCVLNMGIFPMLAGKFLVHTMGLQPGTLPWVISILIGFVALYTIFGGMVSVVLTDFMQYVIMILAMALTTYFALAAVGFGQIVGAVRDAYAVEGFNPIENAKYGWSFIIWALVINFSAGALWPPGTTRALSAETPEIGKKVFWITGLTFMGRAMIPMLWGLAAFAYLRMNALPLPQGDKIQAMPFFLGQVLPTGVIGLVVAGALAAEMSTQSGYLLCWSSIISQDILGPLSRGKLSPHARLTATKIGVACVAIFICLWGFLVKLPETAMRYMYTTGTMYLAGALACIGGGLYWRRANTYGAYAAIISGAAFPAAFLALAQLTESKPDIPAWLGFLTDDRYAALLSFFLAAAAMVVVSLATQRACPPRELVYPEEASPPPATH
ncbi:MAG: sodium:solute symporter family protein [Planctomycetes bacterium]|nr:sodium:solute symporter family protein [Planctomycetota bacterium]